MSVKMTVHTAYSYSPKSRTYFAAAYVLESNHPGLPSNHTFKMGGRTGIGDTLAEAENEAIERAREGARFEAAKDIVRHGRKPLELVQAYCFP